MGSMVRSLVTLTRALSVMAILCGSLGLVYGAYAQERSAVIVAPFTGVVNPVLAGFAERAIDEGERTGATAVVFEMDTPGGLDTSMRQIIRRILAAKVPVIVFVAPSGARAASAGVYIAYSANLAAMAPGTNIGSATPVAMSENGEQQMSDEMRAKVSNDAAAYIRSLAEQRGRNADWAERAVREGINVHADEAQRMNVVNMIAPDLNGLLAQLDGQSVMTAAGTVQIHTADAPVRRLEMNVVESFLHAISDPTIAYLLLSLGTMGIFFELSNPGSVLPGVIGGICLLLGLYALGSLPVNFAGLLFMGLALLLFAADLVAPTHGVLTAGGLISFVFGSMLLINAPDSAPFLQISIQAILAVTITMAGFFVFVIGAVARGRHRPVVTGKEGLVGATGIVRTPLAPRGLVFLQSELWSAVSNGPRIGPGVEIVVTDVDGVVLQVRPSVQLAASPPPAVMAEPVPVR